jgi:adenylate cyclase
MMNQTEIDKQAMERIEQRLWQLVLLAVVVILFLTLAMLALQLFGFFQKDDIVLFSDKAYQYSVSLALVVLLFCIYMITQQRNLSRLSQAFFKEKEAAHTLSQNVKTLSSLMEVSSVINSEHKLSDILDIITQEMLTCFQADQSSIMLLEKESRCLKTEAAFGQGSEIVKDTKVPVGDGVAGRVVETGRPLLLNGKADPADFPGTEKKTRFISSSLCVPLKTGEQCIGVLNINLIDKDRTFTQRHLDLISIFANNAAVAIHNAKLSEERNKRRRLQTMLEQLHSPQIVHELVNKNTGEYPHKMRKKVEMTILFADIRGFSNLLNAVRLEDMMEFLDAYYSAMSEIVFDNGGSIDKFIGDEVMAFFGAPVALQDFNENGLKAAMEMKACFQELRREFSKRSPAFKGLALGIGINRGEVIVGTIGSKRRYEYTVIGAAVNVARRLCSHAECDQILTTKKTLNKTMAIVSSEFVKDTFFKGLSEPVSVHQVTGCVSWGGPQDSKFACERQGSNERAGYISYH